MARCSRSNVAGPMRSSRRRVRRWSSIGLHVRAPLARNGLRDAGAVRRSISESEKAAQMLGESSREEIVGVSAAAPNYFTLAALVNGRVASKLSTTHTSDREE